MEVEWRRDRRLAVGAVCNRKNSWNLNSRGQGIWDLHLHGPAKQLPARSLQVASANAESRRSAHGEATPPSRSELSEGRLLINTVSPRRRDQSPDREPTDVAQQTGNAPGSLFHLQSPGLFELIVALRSNLLP